MASFLRFLSAHWIDALLLLFNSCIISGLIHAWIYIQGSIQLDGKFASQQISWFEQTALIQIDMVCWGYGCKMQHLRVIMLAPSWSRMVWRCNLTLLVCTSVVKKGPLQKEITWALFWTSHHSWCHLQIWQNLRISMIKCLRLQKWWCC